jgi:hypothetical protein
MPILPDGKVGHARPLPLISVPGGSEAAAKRASPQRALSAREFFETLPLAVAPRLPVELRGFDTRRGPGRLLKFDYGSPDAHFEAWHHTAIGRFEVGLHFEGAADFNRAAFEHFRTRVLEVKAALPRAELEPWDRGWARLYETLPAPYLDQALLVVAGARVAAFITTLQPMLVEFLEESPG